MSEIADLSARLAVLETVARQLITHLAIRTDDPPRWVETRKVLALNALAHREGDSEEIRAAVDGFFQEVQAIAGDYRFPVRPETARPLVR
ncbi:MAG TPA: hypothetical protein VHB27_15925 [Rhodopila sp.]|uniref:hypothetical protein n=1 Tax=Rhodopila sp. TaxID=2480087 RepID=UPI002C7A6118|nr:hypothetical protein [Rhodopila sp.]HVY16712.1 hypothetical protein [Rhodopila sp.]